MSLLLKKRLIKAAFFKSFRLFVMFNLALMVEIFCNKYKNSIVHSIFVCIVQFGTSKVDIPTSKTSNALSAAYNFKTIVKHERMEIAMRDGPKALVMSNSNTNFNFLRLRIHKTWRLKRLLRIAKAEKPDF